MTGFAEAAPAFPASAETEFEVAVAVEALHHERLAVQHIKPVIRSHAERYRLQELARFHAVAAECQQQFTLAVELTDHLVIGLPAAVLEHHRVDVSFTVGRDGDRGGAELARTQADVAQARVQVPVQVKDAYDPLLGADRDQEPVAQFRYGRISEIVRIQEADHLIKAGPVIGVLVQHLHHQVIELAADLQVQLAGRSRSLEYLLVHDSLVATFESGLTGEHLVEHQPQAVDVAAVVDLESPGLLRRHVHRGADPGAGHRQPGEHLATCDAEIHQFHRVRIQSLPRTAVQALAQHHDVGGFDVAVDNAGFVDVVERRSDVLHYLGGQFDVQFAGVDVAFE